MHSFDMRSPGLGIRFYSIPEDSQFAFAFQVTHREERIKPTMCQGARIFENTY